MKSKDSDIIRSVAGAALKVMIGEEPDSQEFDQELKKTQTKASKKKTPEEEAGVAKAAVQAVKVEDVNVFDLPLDTMSEEDVASLKSLTQEAMDAVPLSQEQSNLIDKINVIREKYNMTLLQSLNNKKQIGEDKKELKKVSKELAGASKMHKSQSERIKKILPDVKSVDEAHGELHGGQKKLDMNKNNKVDAEDFKMLRAKKKPAKRTVTIDKPDRLVSMKVSKEAVEYVNEVEVLPKGVTRHKAKLAMGAKYGASDYGRGGEEEQTMKKAMTRKSEPKKRGSYGARQNIVRGTKVSGKDVNESASFFDKLTMLEEAPLEAISVALKEGRMKDMVTGHMDKGHSYDDAVKKAQADLDKMKKPKQMSLPLSKQKANEEYEQLDEKKHKKKHSCAEKVKSEEYGIGYCIPEMHTMLEDGTVTHYDVKVVKNGKRYIVRNVPIAEATDIVSEGHKHASKKTKSRKMKEGISPVPNKGKCPSGWELSPDGKKCLRKNLAGKGEAKPRYQMDDSVLKDEGKAIIENYFKHLLEGEEDKAEIVMAAKDMVDRVTSWMEDTAEMQAESMLELGDAIRDEMGQAQSETYIQTVKPGLESLYQSLEATRASLTSGVAKLTGEEEPAVDMGAEAPGMDAGMDAEEPMAEPEDDFGAAEPAAGGEEEAGRAKRESIQRSVRLGQILSSKKK